MIPSLSCKDVSFDFMWLPGEVEQASRSLQAHEVVSQVEMGNVLAVKQIFRHCFQTVAGQVH